MNESKSNGKQLTLCTQCGDIHYKGFWYASDSHFALLVDEKKDSVLHRHCAACKMIAKGACAGELFIKDVPQDLFGPVFVVMRRAAEQDYAENPQHRVLDFAATENGYRLTATSAKMIRRIRRKILDMFETCEAQSSYKKGSYPLQTTNISFSIPGYFNQPLAK